MRLKVGRLRRLVKRDLPIEFGREQLTSYGGLELLRRYFQLIGLTQRLRRGFREHRLGGDYGGAHLVLLVIRVAGGRGAAAPALALRRRRCAVRAVLWSRPYSQRSHRGELAQAVHPSLTACAGAGQQ